MIAIIIIIIIMSLGPIISNQKLIIHSRIASVGFAEKKMKQLIT